MQERMLARPRREGYPAGTTPVPVLSDSKGCWLLFLVVWLVCGVLIQGRVASFLWG